MVRNPFPVPDKDCYGLSYDPHSAVCAGCHLKDSCHVLCGDRITLAQATFDLMPAALVAQDKTVQLGDLQLKRSSVENIYRRCFFAVYGKKWPCSGVGEQWEQIILNAQATGMPVETFISTVIVAYSITHPHTAFPPRMLTAESSVSKVKTYEKLCREKYGYHNLEALGMLVDEDVTSIEKELLHSEITVGRHIIGWKLHVGGPPYASLYQQQELTLSPYWLAIEETYVSSVLAAHIKGEAPQKLGSDMQQRHRHQVLQAHAMMKRRKALARTVFETRTKIMSTAVDHVLRFHGASADDFLVEDKPITDAMKMWNTLGLAILHMECLKALDSAPHKLWR